MYIYLLRYAEAEPDLALLSINTFQRDLADGSPLIRAMALRVLSGIRVPMIGSLVVLAIKKCAADVSPYVRKAAALAIPKCFECASLPLIPCQYQLTRTLADSTPPTSRRLYPSSAPCSATDHPSPSAALPSPSKPYAPPVSTSSTGNL